MFHWDLKSKNTCRRKSNLIIRRLKPKTFDASASGCIMVSPCWNQSLLGSAIQLPNRGSTRKPRSLDFTLCPAHVLRRTTHRVKCADGARNKHTQFRTKDGIRKTHTQSIPTRTRKHAHARQIPYGETSLGPKGVTEKGKPPGIH